MDLDTGTVVDRYTVQSILGEGGMAVVYLCRHNQLGTMHALKVLTMSSRAIRERLVQEGRNLEFQLSESKAEKERLLENIEKLELEILALNQRIEDNKAAIEQSGIDLEKISKMLDQYRVNLRKLQE